MTYQETCQYLYNQMPMFERQGSSGYKEGLTNTLLLDEHLGHPHQSYATIHIAGTNGKGSCSHTIAAILQPPSPVRFRVILSQKTTGRKSSEIFP